MGLFGKSKFKRAFEPYQMPGTPGIGDGIAAETKPTSFWQGGEKFGFRDALSGILAAVGDAFAQQGGGHGGSVQSLLGGRLKAAEMAKEQAQQEQVYKQLIAAGIDPAKAGLVVSGAAKYGDVAPKPEELPTQARMAEWYRTATPEQKLAYDQTNPIITGGYGSALIQRQTLPTGGGGGGALTPMTQEEIRKLGLPEGGPSSPATGGFPRYRR